MILADILTALFPAGHRVTVSGKVFTGEASTGVGEVTVLGTTDAAAIDHRIALTLSGHILKTLAQHPGRPLVMLVDTSGQALSRTEELLCLNASLAHLAQCVDLARRRGSRSLSLVTANAVSGGFLSYGLMADHCYALADVQVRVMDLKAMSRVTKIAHERLQALSATSAIFAPGVGNYVRMGAIEAIWPQPSAELLEKALTSTTSQNDARMALAQSRGGRLSAAPVATTIVSA